MPVPENAEGSFQAFPALGESADLPRRDGPQDAGPLVLAFLSLFGHISWPVDRASLILGSSQFI